MLTLAALVVVAMLSMAPTHGKLFSIYGRVSVPEVRGPGSRVESVKTDASWFGRTHILVDGGKFVGYLKSNNTFAITGLPSGSYVVEVDSADFAFEPVRVDINAKGKVRVRRVNHIQPSQVDQLPYPIEFASSGQWRYFQTREVWKLTDVLMNPMVLMLLLPMLLIKLMPSSFEEDDESGKPSVGRDQDGSITNERNRQNQNTSSGGSSRKRVAKNQGST